jgi:maltooligosyltrehalose trehalohydrolase
VRLAPDGALARVWAPDHEAVEIVLYGPEGSPERALALAARPGGWFEGFVQGARAGDRYRFRLDGGEPLADPCSRDQPEGVHGPSAIDDPAFGWTDAEWPGLGVEDLVLYEVHVGTATPEGTFDALVPRLAGLRVLGVTAVELLPVASFPGRRNWGYDGVDLFAPAAIYGGPAGLRRLVDAAHAAGLGVVLDVVYNHLGPDGNVLPRYARGYFTERHATPWGAAPDFDGPSSGPVRELVLENVATWIRDYHVDGLRLDATDTLHDDSAPHLLECIGERARQAAGGRRVAVIAEDARNDGRIVRSRDQGGFGLDGVWADDLHNVVRRAFTGELPLFDVDFAGTTAELAAVLERGWLFEGQRSRRTGEARGTPAAGVAPASIVCSIQNHDQVGARPGSRRISVEVSPAAYRAMSALLLVSPFTPLLFMGQEWGATMPFPFFTDHPQPLGRRVARARRRELASLLGCPPRAIPSSQAPSTFASARLDWAERERPGHAATLALYRELLALRRAHPALRRRDRASFRARPAGRTGVVLERRGPNGERLLAVVGVRGRVDAEVGPGARVVLCTEEARFGGRGAGVALTSGRLRFLAPAACLVEVSE